MTGFDFIVLAVVGASCVLGLLRGLLKEVLSLIAYILAFLAAVWWGPSVSMALDTYIDNALMRTAAAYGLVFLMALLVVGMVNLGAGLLIQKTGLTPADHGLGMLFGLLRGLLLVLVLVVLAGYTELPRETWWQEARFSGAAVRGVQTIKSFMPPSLASWLPY